MQRWVGDPWLAYHRRMRDAARDFRVHDRADCAGQACCFHGPSDHHMKRWKIEVRFDRSNMVERICQHGIGHPDPDSLAWMRRVGIDDDGTHGCDGCCRPPPA